jgi:nucleoside-triphosphatase
MTGARPLENSATPDRQPPRIFLLTGRPGIGKTTVVRKLAELLTGRQLAGFFTQEIRQDGQRRGFGLTTFGGNSCVLAEVGTRGGFRVGRYRVNVEGFEAAVLPELTRSCEVYLLDEIGKMECFSHKFVAAVRRLLAGSTPIVATVALRGGGFIAEIKRRPDAVIWEVTGSNRDGLPAKLRAQLIPLLA